MYFVDWYEQGGLATAFDLAAFRLSMIAPVKKSVNHSRTVASMRETGWEQEQFWRQEVRVNVRVNIRSLVLLVFGLVSALTNFYRGDV